MWQKLTEVMDTKNNYLEYRNSLSAAKQQSLPVVPFLGKFRFFFFIFNYLKLIFVMN